MSTPNTHYGAEKIGRMLSGCKSIFFIGIGGINMSSLAHISHLRGYRTGGSDRTETALTRSLADCGIEIFYSHDAFHVAGYDAVVYTVAISPENPEYKAARERGIPCISRADYLGYARKEHLHLNVRSCVYGGRRRPDGHLWRRACRDGRSVPHRR